MKLLAVVTLCSPVFMALLCYCTPVSPTGASKLDGNVSVTDGNEYTIAQSHLITFTLAIPLDSGNKRSGPRDTTEHSANDSSSVDLRVSQNTTNINTTRVDNLTSNVDLVSSTTEKTIFGSSEADSAFSDNNTPTTITSTSADANTTTTTRADANTTTTRAETNTTTTTNTRADANTTTTNNTRADANTTTTTRADTNTTTTTSTSADANTTTTTTINSAESATTTATTSRVQNGSGGACPEMCHCPAYGAWAAHLVPYLRQELGSVAGRYTDDVLRMYLLQQLVVDAESPKSIVAKLFDRVMAQGDNAYTMSLWWTRYGITRCRLQPNTTFYLNAAAEKMLFPQVKYKENLLTQLSTALGDQSGSSGMNDTDSPDQRLERYQLYNITFSCAEGARLVVTREAALFRYGRWSTIGCHTTTEGILQLDGKWSFIEVDMTNELALWFENVTVSGAENITVSPRPGDEGHVPHTLSPNSAQPNGSVPLPWRDSEPVFPSIEELRLVNISLSVQQLARVLLWFQRAQQVSLLHNSLGSFNCSQLIPSPTSWRDVTISFTGLTSLPPCLFRTSTVSLDLSNNKISDISLIQLPRYVPSPKLDVLNLTNNNITDVGIITNLNLTFLLLAGNRISYLNKLSFARLPELSYLDLSRNRLHKLDPGSFKTLVQLQYLYLEHNQLQRFDRSHSPLRVGSLPCKIFLGHNRFSHPPFQSDAYNPGAHISVYAAGNPWACDCDMAGYTEATNNSSVTASYVDRAELRCVFPASLEGLPLIHVAFNDTCPIVTHCPQGCVCTLHPDDTVLNGTVVNNATVNDKVVTVDCSAVRDLRFPGTLPDTYPLRLEFQSNGSTEASFTFQDSEFLSRVTSINASGRGLAHVPEFMCEALRDTRVLDLSSNRLSRLPQCLQSRPDTWPLLELHLAHNPWACDCSNTHLASWMAGMTRGQAVDGVMVSDVGEARCGGQGGLVAEWDSSHCVLISYLPWAATLAVVLVVAAVLGPVLYVHRLRAMVTLHARFHVRPFTHTPRYDEDDWDHEALVVHGAGAAGVGWVANTLLPRVHRTRHRLCVPDRDFLLGTSLADAFASSVARAKATVCLLSPQCAGDEWWLYAFQLARAEHARNPDRKLLMVLLEEMGDNDLAQMPQEVREFLKTNTYLSVHDRRFWEKLFFYLPDPPKVLPLP